MTRPKAQAAASSLIEAEYPNQYKRMVGFLRCHAIPENDTHDVINDAWLKAMQTFDPSKGIDPIQWAWWLLERNVLPAYGRSRGAMWVEPLPPDDMLPDAPGEEDDESAVRAMELVNYLKAHLPEDLVAVMDAIHSVKAKMVSEHIYAEVADSLMVSMKEFRNRVKRLRRSSLKLLYQREKKTS
jgi:DNA-directed RNA polymerase specialized sigma24 family protein